MTVWHCEERGGSFCVVDDLTTEVVPDGDHGRDAGAAVNHLKALFAAGPAIVAAALVGSAAPLAPPADWFDVDEPDGPEPLTIEDDGRVHGHLALWDACHVGFMQGSLSECVKPPGSPSKYESFHLGQMVAAGGEKIPVGKVVYGGPHASLTAGLVQAREHYDRTSSVGAFVRARDGKYGIYLSGAARSDLSPEGLRDMRANPPSGDWRRLRGALELVAALAVGIPGYQTPQVALTASGGDVEALILPGYADWKEPDDRGPGFVRQKRAIQASLGNEYDGGFNYALIAGLASTFSEDDWQEWAAVMTEAVVAGEGSDKPWSSYPDNNISASDNPDNWTASWDGDIGYPTWMVPRMKELMQRVAAGEGEYEPEMFDGLEVVIHEAEHFSVLADVSKSMQSDYQEFPGEYWEEVLTETVARLRTASVAAILGFDIPDPMSTDWALYQKYMPWISERIVNPLLERGLSTDNIADALAGVRLTESGWQQRVMSLNIVLMQNGVPGIPLDVAEAQGREAEEWER